jgi:hypothetical protein
LFALLACLSGLFGNDTSYLRNGIEFSLSGLTIESGADVYLGFDVMVRGSASTDRIGTGIILLNYNLASFGSNVFINNCALVIPGFLLSSEPPNNYRIALNDFNPGCLAITYEYTSAGGSGNLLTESFQQLFHIKLKISAFGNTTGLSLLQPEMNLQQYKDDNSTLFSPVSVSGEDNGFLTQMPLNPVLTEQNGTLTLSWQPVSGCFYNVYSSEFPDSGVWQPEALRLTQPEWQNPVPGQHKFYRVTSISSMERE